METSILIMFVIAIVAIYLIFKFIKKMIFAVISAIMVVLLLFGGVIGIAVYDMKALSEKVDFNVNLAYYSKENYILGATLPIVNSAIDETGIKSLSESNFKNLDYTNLDKKGSEFVIKFSREELEKIISAETYSPSFLDNLNLPEESTIKLTKYEILDIIESSDAINKLTDKIFKDNNVNPLLIETLKPTLISSLEEGLSEFGVSFNEALFFDLLMSSVDKNNINYLETLSLYKDDKIEIYPNRLTFSLVKMLPSSFIQGQIVAATKADETLIE